MADNDTIDKNISPITIIDDDGYVSTSISDIAMKDVSVDVLKSNPNTDSAQLEPDNDYEGFSILDNSDIASPSFDINAWARLPQISTRLSQCIRVYTSNTVGLGWQVSPVRPLSEDAPEAIRSRYLYEKNFLEELLFKPNETNTFDDIMAMVISDKLHIGNGYMEVVRNGSDGISELFHVKATSVRVRKHSNGFVQIRGSKKTFFKVFGDTRDMDRETGKYGKVAASKKATEILHFKEYSMSDDFYGVPRWQAALLAVLGTRAAAERNKAFFDNDAVPRMAVLASGAKLGTDSIAMLREFFKQGKGSKNAHRCLVLQLDSDTSGFGASASKPTLDVKPLTIGETDDASFQKYMRANDDEIREVFGIARAFFSPDDVNKSTARETKAITNDQEFNPAATAIEHMLYHTFISSIFTSEVKIKNDKATLGSAISVAKKLISKDTYNNIVAKHSSGLFFTKGKSDVSDMLTNSRFVTDMIVATGIYTFIGKTTDPDSGDSDAEYLLFKNKPLVKIMFNRPKVLDEETKSKIHEVYLKERVLLRNEVRECLGYEPIKDDDIEDPKGVIMEQDPPDDGSAENPLEDGDTK